MSSETMISCEALTKRFGNFTAVDHVSFAVAAGILPAVEGVHPAARIKASSFERPTKYSACLESVCTCSTGLEARLYGRQDARRHTHP